MEAVSQVHAISALLVDAGVFLREQAPEEKHLWTYTQKNEMQWATCLSQYHRIETLIHYWFYIKAVAVAL